MRISPRGYLRIVRASALYDLLVTGPFLTPWSLTPILGYLSTVNQCMGGRPLPEFGPLHMLFAGLMACGVLSWSVVRWRFPGETYGRHDAVARILFSSWMAWALAASNAPVLWLFLVPEVFWGLVQALPVSNMPKETG